MIDDRVVWRFIAWIILSTPICAETKGSDYCKPERPLSVLLVSGLYTGHLYPLVSVGEELVRRGHRVTLIANVLNGSHTYPDFPERVGIKFISSGFDKYWTKASMNEFHRKLYYGNIEQKEILRNSYEAVATSTHQVKNKVEEIGLDQFDIIVCDFGVQVIGAYFHVRGKRTVIFNPMFSIFERADLEWPTPHSLSGQSDELSFLERLVNVVILRPLFHYGLSYLISTVIAEDKGYSDVLKNEEGILYFSGTRMPIITAASFGLQYPIPRLPLMEYVGPVMFHSPPELSSDLKQWLDNKPQNTVIYISMGTTGILPASTVKAIHNGILLHTSYSAVWVMNEKDRSIFDEFDSNVHNNRLYLANWVAQQSLLKHNAVAISFIHCGLNSAHESLFNSHPVVCIPALFDHFDVAARVISAGVGVSLFSKMDKLIGDTKVTVEMVVNAIQLVSVDNYLARNMSRLTKSFRLAGGTRRAADLIEFYEDVGYDHLVPAYVKYRWSWVQYYNCDVWVVLLVAVLTMLWFCWILFKKGFKKVLKLLI